MHKDVSSFAEHGSGEIFRLLVASVMDYAIYLLDPAGHIQTWNEGARRIKGYDDDEVIGRHFSLFYTPEDVQNGKPERGLHAAASSGRWEDEGWRVRKDGSRFWASVVLTALHDADGRLVGFAKVTRDLTERRRAEEERARLLDRERAARVEAEAARDRIRSIQTVTEVALAHLGLDDLLPVLLGRIREIFAADMVTVLLLDDAQPDTLVARAAVGPQGEATRGLRLPLGRGFASRVATERRPIALDDVAQEEAHDPTLREEGVRSLLGVPLLVEGRVIGVLHVGTLHLRHFAPDDMELLQLAADRVALALDQQRLSRAAGLASAAAAAAEAEVQVRDTFLSIAAHELKTPVTGLKVTTQLLLRQEAKGLLDPARLGLHLRRLNTAINRLAILTDDLMDVSRMRTGHLPLSCSPLDLTDLVVEAVNRAREGLEERHTITLAAAAGLAPVLADAARLDQVLVNLLDNAVKYSPAGGTIAVAVYAADAGIQVSISDEGIGLPQGSTESIFAPFGRAENASTRHVQGLGLGLYICRDIVTRHGGRLWAESSGEGCGATFHFWLPLSQESKAP